MCFLVNDQRRLGDFDTVIRAGIYDRLGSLHMEDTIRELGQNGRHTLRLGYEL